MHTRLLGAAGMAGGACLTAIQVRALVTTGAPPDPKRFDRVDDTLYLLWSVGAICALWALIGLRATGRNRILRAAPFLAMAGFAAMIVGSLTDLAGLTEPATNLFAGIAWVLILLGTLVVAILALAARTWPGWRKFAPLTCILAVPLVVLVAPVGAPLFGLAWVLLGYAVLTSAAPAAVPRGAPVPA